MQTIDPGVLAVQPEHAYGGEPRGPLDMVPFDLATPDTAPDEMKRAAARRVSEAVGLPDPDGRVWKGKPFATGAEYLSFMRGMLKSGDVWEYAATDELKAFEAADDAGRVKIARGALGFVDRAAEAAGRAVPEGYGFADGAPELKDAPEDVLAANARLRADREARRRYNLEQTASSEPFREPRAKEEADADKKALDAWRARRRDADLVAAHREKLLRDNLWAAWLSVTPSLSGRAQEIATGLFRDGTIRGEDIADFQRLDETEQAAVARLARLSRHPAAGTFWNTLGDAGIGFINGVATLPLNAVKQIDTLTTSIDQAVFGKDAGLIDNAEMNRRARTEQRLREALNDPAGIDPSGAEHGYLARSLIGAVSTLPYMAYASMGGAGFTAVALDMMQRLDDRIAADGGDVHGQGLEWAARKAVYGGLYAAVERLSALPVFRETGDIALKTAFLKLATRHGAAAAEKVALHVGKETFKQTLEESVQAVIEEHAASVGLGRGDGWADAARSGVREFAETAGTMGLVALTGTARQGIRARSVRGRAELADFTAAALRRESFILSDNPYAGRGSREAVADSWGAAARVLDGYRQTWEGGGLDALKKRTDITEEQAAVLDHVFAAEREGAAVEEYIVGRDLVARHEGDKSGAAYQELGWDGTRQVVAESGADAESRLAELGFTEAGAARVAGYLRQEAALTQRMVRVLGDIRDSLARDADADPGRAARQGRAILSMRDLQPLRTVYQRAGTRGAAAKAFRAMKFTDKQANDLADAFDEERRLAVSPGAASAWKAAYLSGDRSLSPAERLRRMTGFEAAPAPEHGPGAQLLTLRGSDGQKRGEILFRPDSAVAFDPESAHAAEAVEQFTGGLITAAEWRALTPEERARKTREHGFVAAGGFTVTDPADPSIEATGAQADILTGQIDLAPDAPSAELYHEAAHAWLAVMRRAGKITEADIAKLREAYGPSAADPQWFNEEAFADDIREIGAETDYAPDKPLARRFIDAVRRLAGAARAEESRRTAASGARQALYESIVYGKPFEGVGDFAAVPKSSDPAGESKASADPIAGASTAQAATGDGQQETGGKQPETRNQKPETRNPEPETKNQKPEAGRWTAATPQGNLRVGGHWVIAPRDRFISDTDPRYDFSLQNRSRDAALGSSEQVAQIVANFDALRLLDSPDTATGAPVALPVTLKGADGKNETFYMVLSGNGRFRALDQLDAAHRGDEYRNPVKAFADERGIPYDTAHMTAEARPRLVRVLTRRPVGVTLQKLAELSNQNTVLQMTPAERAYSDAALIERDGTADLYAANRDGLPSRNGSDAFFAWFVRAAGDASLMDSQGRPTDAARARARRAMLALAVGRGRRGKETVMAFTEQAEALGLDRQRDALLMSAGALSALGEAKPDYALADEMSRAAADLLMLARERKAGKAVTAAEFIAQGDMLDAMPPAAAEALRILDAARPAEGIAAAFQRYADLAAKIDTDTDDMFGEAPAAKDALLRKAAADTEVNAPAGPRYAIALAARRYALATGMPQEGEELTRRQLEFLFAETADAASRRELAARALAHPDDPEAWDAAFRASPDNTVSRVVHEFYMEHTGDQILNAGMHYFPRAYNGRLLRGMSIRTARDAAAILMPLRNPWQESMKAIYVERGRRRHRVIGGEICTIGLLDTSMVHPREIFKRAVQWNADGIILSHNHPSGDPAPSKEDRAVTLRLEEAGRHLGIEYIDHIITNGRSFYSLRHDRLEAFDPGAKADWEAVPGGTAPRAYGFDAVGDLVGALRQGAGNVVHAIALDAKGRVTAVRRIPFDPARLDPGDDTGDADTKQRRAAYTADLLRDIFRMAVAHPTGGVILDLAADAITPDAARALRARADDAGMMMGIRILDTIYNQDGWAYSVAARRQLLPLRAGAPASAAETRYSLDAAPRYSLAVTPEQDAAYMRAVEAGDMETAQRMVDEAAKAAGVPIEVRQIESLKPLVGFKPDSQIKTNDMRPILIDSTGTVLDGNHRLEAAKRRGDTTINVVISKADKNTGRLTVNEDYQRIYLGKSADAVTRDAEGRVIPLSERFNEAEPDIRFRKQTETPEFKRWFGDSKVVDADGKPLVVYHGTTGDFDAFDVDADSRSGHPSAGLGVFFTASPNIASQFARDWEGAPMFARANERPLAEGANTMPVYLSIQNPVIMTDREFRDLFVDRGSYKVRSHDAFRSLRASYEAAGHDGIIIGPSGEAVASPGLEEYTARQFVAFRPDQIKSATGNRGTFDPDNPDIRFKLHIRFKLPGVTLDAEYADAVAKGDMETAQRMVDEAAKAAGYDRETFRGDSMPDDIVVYDPKERREVGIFTTPVREIADVYANKGGRLSNASRRFYVRAPKVLDLTKDNLSTMRWVAKWAESFDEWIDRQTGEEVSAFDILQSGRMFDYEGDWSSERWMDLQATAEIEGYDAVVLPDYDSERGVFPSLVVFDSKNLKLADPATYDDNGNLIPLSRRFDDARADIRYSLDAAARRLLDMPPVARVAAGTFAKSDVDLVTQASEFLKALFPDGVDRPGLGNVRFTRGGVRSSIAHGIGRAKAAAFAAVPDIVLRGVEIDRSADWKGRGYGSAVIAAPVEIGGTEYIAEVVVREEKEGGWHFYLHEVEEKEKLRSAFKTGMDTSAPQSSRLIIAKLAAEVNRGSGEKKDGPPGIRFKLPGVTLSEAAREYLAAAQTAVDNAPTMAEKRRALDEWKAKNPEAVREIEGEQSPRVNPQQARAEGRYVSRPTDAEPDLSTADVAFYGGSRFADGFLYRGIEGEAALADIASKGQITSTSETAKRLGKNAHVGMTFLTDYPNIASSYVQRDGYVLEIRMPQDITAEGGGEIQTTRPIPADKISRIFAVGTDAEGPYSIDVTDRFTSPLTLRPDGTLAGVQEQAAPRFKLPGVTPDVEREFASLTSTLKLPKGTRAERQAALDEWIKGNPKEYAALEKLRGDVLKAAGYTIKGFHNSGSRFNVFDLGMARTSSDIQGFFFKDQRDSYQEYGPVEYSVFLKVQNPAKDEQALEGFSPASTDDAGVVHREKLISQGYDGAIFSKEWSGMDYTEIVVFSPSQIKSADPLALDDSGELITPRRWAEEGTADIRYSLQARRLDPYALPDSLAEVSAGTSVAALAQSTFKAEHARHRELRAAQEWAAARRYAGGLAADDRTRLLGNYLLAKYHGDAAAAKAVVERWAKPEEAEKIRERIGDTGLLKTIVFAPAMQREGDRFNALPAVYAQWLAQKINGVVSPGFRKVEGSGAPNTGAAVADRVNRDYAFEGGEGIGGASPVILVDDVWTSGQTLWTVYEHLKAVNPSAHVAAFATLASGRYGKNVRPTAKQLTAFWEKSNLTSKSFKERLGNGIEKLTGSEIQAYILTGGRGPDAAAAFFGGGTRAARGADAGDSRAVRLRSGSGEAGLVDAPVRYALDLTGSAYSKESLLVGFMAHADLTGRAFPSRGTVAALAEKIGLENHRYDDLARRARALAEQTTDDAIRKAAASADPGHAAYAIGELARRAERALVRAGAEAGARLARNEDRIRTLSEAGVAAAMRAVTGADYADIETDTDIDIAASILAADPKAFEPQAEKPPADTQPPAPAGPDADPDAPADPAAPDETDEEAPELTDRQRAEIARRRREREARIQAMLDAARDRAARNRARDEERRRRKAANEKTEAEEEAAAAASGAGDAGGTDAASAPAPAAPGAEETGPAAPVDFSDRWEAAAFLRVWAFDRFRRDNPNRRDTEGDLSRNKVAVEFYRKTAVRELTALARKLLAPGAPRETVRAMIGDIVYPLTANQIERRTAHVFGVINRHAVREKQRSLVKKFRAEIKRQYIKGKEFEELGVDIDRTLTGAIEEDARYIMRVCELSDRALDGETSALQDERNRLEAIIAQREGMTDEAGNPLDVGKDDMAARRAMRQLALLDKYGAMVDMMPGEILDLTGDALATLGREAVALRERWAEYDKLVKSIRDPLARSIARGVDDPAASESVWNAVADSQLSMLRQRLDFLTRYEADPARREAARAAVSDLMDLLARGNVEYTNAVADDRAALMGALGQIFRRDDGRPDRKKIRAYLRRLDERIPAELAARLTRQGRQNAMTYGQMLHLLAYLDQWASYKDNIIRHDRRGQAALIRSFVFEDPKTGEARRALTNEDTQLVEWLRRAHYAGKRGAISDVTRRLAGRGIDSPDPLYHPVKMLLSRTSALAAAPGGAAWQPMAGAFSRRVRNSLDVDETASILDLFHSRSHDTAVLTAFGERGMVIREILTSRGFQDAVRRFHGDRALSKILRQVAQSLDGGRARGGGQSAAASMAQRLTTYMYLGFNPHSAAKQSASLPVFAARLGFRRLGSILFSPIDRAAVRRLRASDEYRARYGTGPASGMNAADRAAYDAPDADPLKKVFGDWGLWMTRKADWAISAWVGQGVYRDLKAKYLDQGMGEDEADRRAISETFTLIEETQQSGRAENLPELSREHGFLGRLMVQFATSPLQQMQYELKELAEWRDLAANGGTEQSIREARNKFMRALFINHVIVPGIMAGISGIYKAATGDEPDWKKEGYWQTLLIAAIMGQFGRIFFAGALAEQTLRVLFLRKPPYMGQLVPAEGVIRFAGNLAYPVRDIVTWDMEHFRGDIMRLLKSIALTRVPARIYERATAGE